MHTRKAPQSYQPSEKYRQNGARRTRYVLRMRVTVTRDIPAAAPGQDTAVLLIRWGVDLKVYFGQKIVSKRWKLPYKGLQGGWRKRALVLTYRKFLEVSEVAS